MLNLYAHTDILSVFAKKHWFLSHHLWVDNRIQRKNSLMKYQIPIYLEAYLPVHAYSVISEPLTGIFCHPHGISWAANSHNLENP